MGTHAQLADPANPEEMAMTFTVGGLKTGFGRETFLPLPLQQAYKSLLRERLARL